MFLRVTMSVYYVSYCLIKFDYTNHIYKIKLKIWLRYKLNMCSCTTFVSEEIKVVPAKYVVCFSSSVVIFYFFYLGIVWEYELDILSKAPILVFHLIVLHSKISNYIDFPCIQFVFQFIGTYSGYECVNPIVLQMKLIYISMFSYYLAHL